MSVVLLTLWPARQSVWCGLSSVSQSGVRQIHTLSKLCVEQNPYAGTGPVIAKALVVCPVSLVDVRHIYVASQQPVEYTCNLELESRISQMVSDLPIRSGSSNLVQ